jgi:LysM repeat protein
MNTQSLSDRARLKRSLIMKVGSAVLGLHITALVAFALTQGCVTTESQGSGRGAGAKHKGPWRHEHTGKGASSQAVAADSMYAADGQSAYDPVIIDSGSSSSSAGYAAAGAGAGAGAAAASTYDNSDTYIVQQGDVLSRIAADCGTTTQTLIDMNNLSNPDVLYVGQEIRVPAGSKKSSSSSRSAPTVQKGGEYVIQSGDTLSGIAVAAGVSVADLRSLNNVEDDKIFAGETLSIPSGGKVPTDTQKSTPKEAASVEPTAAEPAAAPMAAAAGSGSMQVDAVMDHVVYPGESLDDISRQYGVGKSDIMRLNNISDESAVKEGQRLRIPISE